MDSGTRKISYTYPTVVKGNHHQSSQWTMCCFLEQKALHHSRSESQPDTEPSP